MRHLLNLVTSGFLVLVVAGVASAQESQTSLESGTAWFDKGDFDNAIRDYTQAIRLDPKSAVAYCNRGLAWSNKGDFDKAIAAYAEAGDFDLAVQTEELALALPDNEPDDIAEKVKAQLTLQSAQALSRRQEEVDWPASGNANRNPPTWSTVS